MDGRGKSENVKYEACILPMDHSDDVERPYIGISSGNLKQRLYYHRH